MNNGEVLKLLNAAQKVWDSQARVAMGTVDATTEEERKMQGANGQWHVSRQLLESLREALVEFRKKARCTKRKNHRSHSNRNRTDAKRI